MRGATITHIKKFSLTKSIGNGDPLLECSLLDLWEFWNLFQNYNFIVWRKHVLELFDKK
jgi:hypothetical protein